MKNLKFTFGAAMLVLAMSLTAAAKSGTISTTKTGTISTTKTGTISTTGTTSSSRAGIISTTRTGLISTTRNESTPSLDRFRLFELLLTVLGPW